MACETEHICETNKVVNENENNSKAEMEITRRDEQFDINEGIQAEDICINMDDANVTQCQEDCQKTNDGMFSHPIDIRHSETSKPIQCIQHKGTVPLCDSFINYPGQNDKTSNISTSTMSAEETVCNISTPKTERKSIVDIPHKPKTNKAQGLTPMAPRDGTNKEQCEINMEIVCEKHHNAKPEAEPMIPKQLKAEKRSAVDKKKSTKQSGQDKRQSTQNIDVEGNHKETTDDLNKHKPLNILLCKGYGLCLLLTVFILTSLISLTLSIYVVIVYHVSTSFIQPENITTNGNMQIATIQSVSAHIDWKAIEHVNPNNIVNISWIVNKPNFIQLDNSGQLINVTGNGTYAIFATFNLDIESAKSHINSKNRTISTLICIKNSRSKDENCQKQRLPPKTAVTVPLFTVIPLLKGDFIWISMKGVDQIYKSNAGNYLTIIRHPT